MKYYIVAGERSGDLHASNLIKALKKEDSQAQFRGFGGDYMQAQGTEIVVHIREMAFMGFWEVAKGFFKIMDVRKQCKKDILANRPDVLILVDYGGFNMRLAKWAKSKGIKVFYYISPKVWAWNTSRAWKLRKTVDEMFLILPFEEEFFKKFDGWQTHYVGNPVVDAVQQFVPNPDFRRQNGLAGGQELIALLPGSRKQELRHILPTFVEVAQKNPDKQFVIAAVKSLDASLYAPALAVSNISLVYDQTYDLYQQASAAIVTSGTATLETGLFELPQVVAYRSSSLSYRIAKWVAKVDYISLVNLIADKEVVKELIQDDMSAENLNRELHQLLDRSGNRRKEMIREYKQMKEKLGNDSASARAAKKMTSLLHK
ncbi:MAG: lipid-A-disaccharide synthase [Cytophagales bacterium]|nr:lipid-A-disaccharide synthase [Cytophagales bacterium]